MCLWLLQGLWLTQGLVVFSGTRMGDKRAVIWAESLKSVEAVRVLDVSHCNIASRGAWTILHQLHAPLCTSLKELHIGALSMPLPRMRRRGG